VRGRVVCAYEVELFNYIADVKGGDWTAYRVEIDHQSSFEMYVVSAFRRTVVKSG